MFSVMNKVKHNPLSQEDVHRIESAIVEAEAKTDAEIVVRVVKNSRRVPIGNGKTRRLRHAKKLDPEVRSRARAEQEFLVLGIEHTVERHGVLVFISIEEKCVEIIADTSVGEKLNGKSTPWEAAGKSILNGFESQTPGAGIAFAVALIGETLAENFPKTAGDTDELPNTVVQGD